ncbi:MAG: lipid II flippase MurJ [Candidatus Woesebacteria bacterium]|jgi:putative peptidoglycan lipid II flippase
MKNLLSKANGRLSVSSAAALLAGSSLLSTLLGLYRERLLVGNYYDTYPTAIDAYKVAFTVPDFMFFVLVSGALSVTFIPVLNERLSKGNKKSAWELSSSLLNLMAVATMIVSVLIMIFAGPLIRYLVAPGLDEVTSSLAVSMMRVIAINPLLFAISSVLSSMQQAVGKFFFFALAPSMYSVGIIFGAVVLVDGINVFGFQLFEGGIMGVALGVVLGSIAQLIVSSLGMRGLDFRYQFKIFWRNLGFRKVLSMLPARSIDQGMDYFNYLVEINLASRLREGMITAYQVATQLHMVPITLIGVAISTAAFPKMTERIAQGQSDLFKQELQTVLRVIIWLALPTAVVAFLGRGYLVSFVKYGGDPLMADILGLLAIAILFRSIYHIASRSFYAQQDTKTPLYISIAAIALNIAIAIWFVTKLDFGVLGLAAAQSIVSFVEVVILFFIMSSRIKGLFDADFVQAVLKMISASGLMFVVTYVMVKMFDLTADATGFFALIPKFALIVVVGLGSYLIISKIFRLKETKPVMDLLKRTLFRRYKVLG